MFDKQKEDARYVHPLFGVVLLFLDYLERAIKCLAELDDGVQPSVKVAALDSCDVRPCDTALLAEFYL